MDYKSYIESGLLEAYVAGILPEPQMEEVRVLAEKYPEVRVELDKIEEAMMQLAMTSEITPPEGAEAKILDHITKRRPSSGGSTRTTSASSGGSGSGDIWKWVVALLAVGLIGLGVYLYSYRTHCEQMTSSLDEIRAEQQQFATEYAGIQSQLDSVQRAIAVMSDRDFTKVVMAGTDNAPESHATIFWNASTSQLYLIVGSLKALAADQQYQLWAIVDGNPIDAGVFDLDGDYLTAMKEISGNAATFAVTIEPLGGSEGPSLETMQVAGNL